LSGFYPLFRRISFRAVKVVDCSQRCHTAAPAPPRAGCAAAAAALQLAARWRQALWLDARRRYLPRAKSYLAATLLLASARRPCGVVAALRLAVRREWVQRALFGRFESQRRGDGGGQGRGGDSDRAGQGKGPSQAWESIWTELRQAWERD
jgi:uncharacterized membrane protein YgcG